MLKVEIGETVEWRIGNAVFSGVVTAKIDKKRILVGLRMIVRISDLTAILY